MFILHDVHWGKPNYRRQFGKAICQKAMVEDVVEVVREGGGRATKFPISVRVRLLIFATLASLIFVFFVYFLCVSSLAFLRSAARRSPTPCSGSSLVCRCLMSCLAPYPIPMSIFSATFAHLCPCCSAFPQYLGWDSIILMSVRRCSIVYSPVHVFVLSDCLTNFIKQFPT